ncbi:MAG: NADH-quinone oxidoreductase subunit L, partial [Nitrospinales bacterium]
LLVGAFAKSAQIPLHTWLPDAMEGPTPVSALIHAATMVTAGVYLVARCHVLFDLAPYTLFLVAAVGILTAVFAGSMGMVQHDIKRIIAYSTMSQLGYMFLAAGIGAYSVAMFHLMTHAFFKALLFLGAGSVIHALNDEQDIRKMGGLRFVMPVTFYTFLIGALALSSFPLTSGFFSKEQILINAWYADGSNIVFWAIGIFTAGMTGFYAFRLFFYTFHGDLKSPDAHPHEAPQMMVGVLVVLAFFSLFIGFAAPLVHGFLAPVFGGQAPPHYENHILEGIAIAAGIGGILTAGALYLTGSDKLEFAKQIFAPFYDLLYRKYYVDEIYDFLIVRPMRATAAFFWRKGEVEGIDYVVDQVGAGVRETSYGISLWQSGKVRFYALNMLAGAVLILLFVVFL